VGSPSSSLEALGLYAGVSAGQGSLHEHGCEAVSIHCCACWDDDSSARSCMPHTSQQAGVGTRAAAEGHPGMFHLGPKSAANQPDCGAAFGHYKAKPALKGCAWRKGIRRGGRAGRGCRCSCGAWRGARACGQKASRRVRRATNPPSGAGSSAASAASTVLLIALLQAQLGLHSQCRTEAPHSEALDQPEAVTWEARSGTCLLAAPAGQEVAALPVASVRAGKVMSVPPAGLVRSHRRSCKTAKSL